MTEDEIYRTSTQYRLWSFTEASLASLQSTTNSLAVTRVKAAIQRQQSEKELSGTADNDGAARDGQGANNGSEVDCLTVEEEQKIVGFYCIQAMNLADFCKFPTNVKATAVQYLKRFYLSNSPMAYHPKQMMPSALFLATKTEHWFTKLTTFAEKLPNITAEEIVAPEFLLTQGLRFTFDVRHPHRGLEGGIMELLAWSSSQGDPSPGMAKSAKELQQELIGLEPAKPGRSKAKSVEELTARIHNAHAKVKEDLKTSALLTDVYFLYTPSQIWLAALLLIDEPLTLFYVGVKVASNPQVKAKLIVSLRACAELLSSSKSVDLGEEDTKEAKRIVKKLFKCRNPDKSDLVSINKAQKREGEGKDENAIKKRKLERENGLKEAESVFGPDLGSNGKA